MHLMRRLICGLVFAYAGLVISARLIQLGGGETIPVIQHLDPYTSARSQRQTLTNQLDQIEANAPSKLRVNDLAIAAPLDPLPFTIRMIEQASSSEFGPAATLAKHVKLLDPRHRVAHFISAQIALENAQPNEALNALERLVILDRDNQRDYLAGMVQVVMATGDIAAIEDLLDDKPTWGGQFVNMLSDDLHDVRILQRLYKYYPENQSSFVRAVAKSGDLERAYIAFLSFLNDEELGAMTVPYDSDFKGLTGAKPFNWLVNEKFGELERNGGLYVNFFGKGRPTLSEQILVLSPRQYIATVEMGGELYQYGGSFEWIIQCVGKRENLMTIPIDKLAATKSTFRGLFDVPPTGCNFQRLRLLGVAGEYPRTTRAKISSVTISAAIGPDQ